MPDLSEMLLAQKQINENIKSKKTPDQLVEEIKEEAKKKRTKKKTIEPDE